MREKRELPFSWKNRNSCRWSRSVHRGWCLPSKLHPSFSKHVRFKFNLWVHFRRSIHFFSQEFANFLFSSPPIFEDCQICKTFGKEFWNILFSFSFSFLFPFEQLNFSFDILFLRIVRRFLNSLKHLNEIREKIRIFQIFFLS